MAVIEIAIDMGSSNTTIYKKGRGIVLKEPSVLCLQNNDKVFKVLAIGNDAKKMQGRTEDDSVIVSPIVEGVVKNIELATEMMQHFLAKISPRPFTKYKALVCLPCGVTEDEMQDFRKVMYSSGVGRVSFASSLVCMALGNINAPETKAYLGVNIGGGKTEVGAILNNVILSGCSVGIGGKMMDSAICEYVKEGHNLKISNITAEKVKNEIATLYDTDKSNLEVSGADLMSNRYVTDIVHAREVRDSIIGYFDRIVAAILSVINECQPDVVADIHERGIYVCGGVSQTTGIETYLRKLLDVPVVVCDQPENIVILGAGKLISDSALYSEIVGE